MDLEPDGCGGRRRGAGAELPAKTAGGFGHESSRVRLAPRVRAIVNADSPEGRLARAWVRYARGLVGVTQITFSGDNTIETELHGTGTHLGELLGHAPTGRSVRFVIHTLGRFKGDRLAQRWDRMDFAGLLRQLGEGGK